MLISASTIADVLSAFSFTALLIGVALTVLAITYAPHVARWREGRKRRRWAFHNWTTHRGGDE